MPRPEPTPPSPYPMPFTRVETVTLSLMEARLRVLLVRRAAAPFAETWALPGGVLRIDRDASLEAAARRVLRERLAVDAGDLQQMETVGGAQRDPRAPWTLSVVYRAIVPAGSLVPVPGKRVREVAWFDVDHELPSRPLAFDHGPLIARAVARLRADVARLELPLGALAPTFTLGELQAWCEQLLGRNLDKSSFRRRLAERDLVEALPGERREGPFRPAQVYRAREATPHD